MATLDSVPHRVLIVQLQHEADQPAVQVQIEEQRLRIGKARQGQRGVHRDRAGSHTWLGGREAKQPGGGFNLRRALLGLLLDPGHAVVKGLEGSWKRKEFPTPPTTCPTYR